VKKESGRRDFLIAAGGMTLGSFIPNYLTAQESGAKRDVILCFDGNEPLKKWRRVLDFGKELEDITQKPAHFTIFGNSCFLVSKGSGRSEIGWGGSKEDIDERVKLTQEAINSGHEFASHTVRHLHGGNWSYQQWYDELAEFDETIAKTFVDKSGEKYKSVGFRAPFLEFNNNMFKALGDLNYVYDTSPPGNSTSVRSGVIVMDCPIWQRPNGKSVLGMDYNWMFSAVSNQELTTMLEKEGAKRDPFIISMHFTDYKPGVYGEPYITAVENFMREGAKEGRFNFPSGIEYVEANKDKLVRSR